MEVVDFNKEKVNYLSLIEEPIFEGKNICDLLTYDGDCYWWVIDSMVHQTLLRETIKNSNSATMQTILHYTFSYLPILLFGYDFASKILWRRQIKKLSERRMDDKTHSSNILYRMGSEEWRLDSELNNKYVNVYNNPITDILSNGVGIYPVYDVPIELQMSKMWLKKYMDTQINGIHHSNTPLITLQYWSPKCWVEEIKAFRHFKKIYNIIEIHDDWFKKWAEVSGSGIEFIKNLFKSYIQYSIPVLIRNRLIYEKILSEKNVSAFLFQDEQSPNGRIIQMTCRKWGVPTIALQHGVMAKQSGYFDHNPNRILGSGCEKNDTGFPVPDITCVWGVQERNLLINDAGYPKETVVVTGNVRYNKLSLAQDIYSREIFCDKYKLNKNNHIILWVTQSHGFPYDENITYITDVLNMLKQTKNTTLIIKQHPQEPSEYSEMISKLISQSKLNDKVVLTDKMADTTEMVYISDIVILHSSTTGQEAIAFRKPLIIMDFSDKPDYAKYVEEGVGIPAFKKGTLTEIVQLIINNETKLPDDQYDKYILNHLYKLDGLAAERVTNIVYSLVNKNREG